MGQDINSRKPRVGSHLIEISDRLDGTDEGILFAVIWCRLAFGGLSVGVRREKLSSPGQREKRHLPAVSGRQTLFGGC